MHVGVIGAGIMGSAAAWRLALRGHQVVLFEQFDLGHVRGSSHGAARIFRLTYDRPEYIRLAAAALPLWREAERDLAAELLWQTGNLTFGWPSLLDPMATALAQVGVEFERLDADAVQNRCPAFRPLAGHEAILQTDGGVAMADAARRGFVELAQRRGAEVRQNQRVEEVIPTSNGVVIRTTDETVAFDMAVVAAAGWATRLLEPLSLAVPLRVTREQTHYFHLRPGFTFLSAIVTDPDLGLDAYTLPNGHGGEIKAAGHDCGPETDPDDDGELDPIRIDEARQLVEQWLPGVHPQVLRSETCLYASTPDDDFVLDRHGPLVLGIGFGGHGFKFGPAIGEVLADLVDGAATSPTFARARFTGSIA